MADLVNLNQVFNEKLIELYNSGLSTYKIAKKVGIPKTRVLKLLWNSNVEMRNCSDRVRKYSFNENFFSTFTPESCYWAGMLAADGCIGKKYHYKICLGLIDKEHIEKFVRAVGFNGKIYQYKRTSLVVLSSDKMASDLLNNFGIGPCKTFTIKPPMLPDDMKSHFIRGYVDGDGNYAKSRPQISAIGTKEMITWMRNILSEVSGGKPSVLSKGKMFTFSFGGRIQVYNIVKWLYENSTEEIRLDRKFLIAERYIGNTPI